jgi:hypothetical protein
LAFLSCFLPIRIILRNYFNINNDLSPEKIEILREIEIWKDVSNKYKNFKEIESNVSNKIEELSQKFKENNLDDTNSIEILEKTYKINNPILLVKSLIVLIILLILFSIETYVHNIINLSMVRIIINLALASINRSNNFIINFRH